jgi:hypothetical protein
MKANSCAFTNRRPSSPSAETATLFPCRAESIELHRVILRVVIATATTAYGSRARERRTR